MTRCEMCGPEVRVYSADEGTCSYVPITEELQAENALLREMVNGSPSICILGVFLYRTPNGWFVMRSQRPTGLAGDGTWQDVCFLWPDALAAYAATKKALEGKP